MAERGNFCIPAFNVYNIETVMGVIEAAEEKKAPVIIQVYPRLVNEQVGYYIAPVALAAAKKASVPVCFHLDHATDLESIKAAIAAGFSSVMFDGSVLPFDDNAKKTAEVTAFAHAHGVTVEAELGHVGNAMVGNENDSVNNEDPEDTLTLPDEVVRFVEMTDVDALAIAIGTAHGVYLKTPTLRIDRLDEITAVCDRPLVLHGGSGTPDDQMKMAIEHGITKINIFSDVVGALNAGLKNKLNTIQNPSTWPAFVFEDARKGMREAIRTKIHAFGSFGRV
jgi:ketose-bisphosphate aldolase